MAQASGWSEWTAVVDEANKKLKPRPAADPAKYEALAKAMAAANANYVPKKGLPTKIASGTDMHPSLEKVALHCLKEYLGIEDSQAIETTLQGYTTTDIDAALQVRANLDAAVAVPVLYERAQIR